LVALVVSRYRSKILFKPTRRGMSRIFRGNPTLATTLRSTRWAPCMPTIGPRLPLRVAVPAYSPFSHPRTLPSHVTQASDQLPERLRVGTCPVATVHDQRRDEQGGQRDAGSSRPSHFIEAFFDQVPCHIGARRPAWLSVALLRKKGCRSVQATVVVRASVFVLRVSFSVSPRLKKKVAKGSIRDG
jgi:hypothetical protein